MWLLSHQFSRWGSGRPDLHSLVITDGYGISTTVTPVVTTTTTPGGVRRARFLRRAPKLPWVVEDEAPAVTVAAVKRKRIPLPPAKVRSAIGPIPIETVKEISAPAISIPDVGKARLDLDDDDDTAVDLLTFTEYRRLARFLHENKRQPSDLLAPDADILIAECSPLIKSDRLKRLLERGFLLSQAIERWQARAIWVVSRADDNYPVRLKKHLKSDAPPVLYGCGDAAILETGGLAVVGSRHVDDTLVKYTESIGRLAAAARCTIVSGGARGIDQAAMRGALEVGGKVTGILADSLERTAMNREHRNLLIEGQLVLISPYDPSAGFNVGHAMQRNKLIYACSEAALVVSSDYEKGGTWAGAVEQLENALYQFGGAEIQRQFSSTLDHVIEQVRATPQNWSGVIIATRRIYDGTGSR